MTFLKRAKNVPIEVGQTSGTRKRAAVSDYEPGRVRMRTVARAGTLFKKRCFRIVSAVFSALDK